MIGEQSYTRFPQLYFRYLSFQRLYIRIHYPSQPTCYFILSFSSSSRTAETYLPHSRRPEMFLLEPWNLEHHDVCHSAFLFMYPNADHPCGRILRHTLSYIILDLSASRCFSFDHVKVWLVSEYPETFCRKENREKAYKPKGKLTSFSVYLSSSRSFLHSSATVPPLLGFDLNHVFCKFVSSSHISFRTDYDVPLTSSLRLPPLAPCPVMTSLNSNFI